MMGTLRLIREIPFRLAMKIQQWVLANHRPEVVEGEAWCFWPGHRQPRPWPCEDFIRADRDIDGLLEAKARW